MTQILRLKDENARLRQRLTERDTEVHELAELKTTAFSRLTAQHLEILQLREALAATSVVKTLSRPAAQAASARSSTSISIGQ